MIAIHNEMTSRSENKSDKLDCSVECGGRIANIEHLQALIVHWKCRSVLQQAAAPLQQGVNRRYSVSGPFRSHFNLID